MGNVIDIRLFDQSTQIQVQPVKSDNTNVCPVGYTKFAGSDNTLSSYFIDKCNACESNKGKAGWLPCYSFKKKLDLLIN